MFEKASNIYLRVTEEEKALISLLAKRSPQREVADWLMYLIDKEYKRIIEFDNEVQVFVQK